jgi:hypothetical protein
MIVSYVGHHFNLNFNLFWVDLIHKVYDPSDMELVNTENKVTNIIHDVRYNTNIIQ